VLDEPARRITEKSLTARVETTASIDMVVEMALAPW
jgi:hypothetical protein